MLMMPGIAGSIISRCKWLHCKLKSRQRKNHGYFFLVETNFLERNAANEISEFHSMKTTAPERDDLQSISQNVETSRSSDQSCTLMVRIMKSSCLVYVPVPCCANSTMTPTKRWSVRYPLEQDLLRFVRKHSTAAAA